MQKILRCTQHSNPIQRICINTECENRILCLLCQTHLHGKQFLSILDKPSQSYKRFSDIICEQIDSCLVQMTTNQDQLIRNKQKQLLNEYFKLFKSKMLLFLDQKWKQVQQMLSSQKQQILEVLKSSRLSKDFISLDSNIFNICLRVYQGQKISQILQKDQSNKSELVYKNIDSLHYSFKQIMQKNNFNLKLQIPQIRDRLGLLDNKVQINKRFNEQNYDINIVQTNKLSSKLIYQTQPFNSIISSSLKTINEDIITVSYDKTLRIHKRSNKINPTYDLVKQLNFSNILTKIHPIGQDIYAIGQSKQLMIQKISQVSKDQWQCTNLMKLIGHQERIQDIHSYNTRIIGSSSYEGTKIWDLYKQRCQFTFKQTYNPSTFQFLPKINNIAIGYNNHLCKIYSMQNLKNIHKYELPGLPLVFSQQKLNQNTFYVGGFSSNLSVIDVRLNNLAFNYNFKDDAVSSLSQMLFKQNKILLGFRNGNVKIFDLLTRKVRLSFTAQQNTSHLSKPNGIIGVYQQGENQVLSVGCNDKKLKLWELTQDKGY